VGRFVMDMSLDVLRAGGTGEARLRTRRHSAYGASGGDESAASGRCSALIKPSTTDQLRGLMAQASAASAASGGGAAAPAAPAVPAGPAGPAGVGGGGRLSRSGGGGSGSAATARKFVAFTITDATYGDMLNDVWAGVHRLGMERSFFFVALDKPTALAACHHHMPVLFFKEPLTLPDSKGLPPRSSKFASTKDRVYEAK